MPRKRKRFTPTKPFGYSFARAEDRHESGEWTSDNEYRRIKRRERKAKKAKKEWRP